MENLQGKIDRDNRLFTLESLIFESFDVLATKSRRVHDNPLKYDNVFCARLVESGGKEVDALFDFIHKVPLFENDFGKDQELDTLYCLAYEFLALKHKIQIPQFILDYKKDFLQQFERGVISLTETEQKWLILIKFKENLKIRLHNNKPSPLN